MDLDFGPEVARGQVSSIPLDLRQKRAYLIHVLSFLSMGNVLRSWQTGELAFAS